MSRYETRLKSHRVKPEKLAFKASFPIIETHLTLVSLEVSMELEAVAKALKELGHPTRLCIYKEVVKAGYKGIAVGGVQEKTRYSCIHTFSSYFQFSLCRTHYSAP